MKQSKETTKRRKTKQKPEHTFCWQNVQISCNAFFVLAQNSWPNSGEPADHLDRSRTEHAVTA